MPDRLIQPVLHPFLLCGILFAQCAFGICSVGGALLGPDIKSVFRPHRFQIVILFCILKRLYHVSSVHILPVDGHMLVPGQQNVKIQFLTDAVSDILRRLLQALSGL